MLQRRQWAAGVILWSMGVGVKMTLLLVAPAVAVIVVLGTGIVKAAGLGITALLLQVRSPPSTVGRYESYDNFPLNDAIVEGS